MPINYDIGPPAVHVDDYISDLITMHQIYGFDKFLVWEDMEGINPANIDRYFNFYAAVSSGLGAAGISVPMYGPNTEITWSGGALDSGDEGLLLVSAAAGLNLAFRANIADSEWVDLMDYIRENISENPVIATVLGTPSDPALISSAFTARDTVLWPASLQNSFDFPSDYKMWNLQGTLTINNEVTNFTIRTDVLSSVLQGPSRSISIYEDLQQAPILTTTLPFVNQVHNFGSLGIDGSPTTYYYRISGYPASTGQGTLKVSFFADNLTTASVQDYLVIVG